MKAIGTNTDSSTSVIAMIGAVICAIAFLRRLGWRKIRLLLHHALDILDDDDRVINHDADSEHHREQRDRIGRIAEHQQHREGADQADRNGNRRNHGGAQIAEEQKNHDHDQHEGFAERLQHLR